MDTSGLRADEELAVLAPAETQHLPRHFLGADEPGLRGRVHVYIPRLCPQGDEVLVAALSHTHLIRPEQTRRSRGEVRRGHKLWNKLLKNILCENLKLFSCHFGLTWFNEIGNIFGLGFRSIRRP